MKSDGFKVTLMDILEEQVRAAVGPGGPTETQKLLLTAMRNIKAQRWEEAKNKRANHVGGKVKRD